jgi:hypothetical protein
MTATISGDGTSTLINLTTSGNTILGDASTDTLNVGNGGLVKDASGNVGIGTSSPAQTLHVKTATSATPITLGVLSNATSLPALSFNGAYASTTMAGIYGNGATASSLYYQVPSGQNHYFGIADVTKMTIDSSGNLLVGTTTALGKFTVEQNLGGVADSVGIKDTGSDYGSGAVYINFRNNAGSVAGKIEHTASTTVNYNTSSDARLKKNIGIATDTSVIDQIVIHDFEWKEDGRVDRGVFAQEAYEIKPSAVSVGSDETNENDVLINSWGVDYSKFVPDLIVHAQQLKKQVQEQQAIITQLQADVEALKGTA